ncbi:MAG: ribose 5-phosphate isomerase A [Candidatus Altiarchaeales archaeon]|nr:MAG: ribose 5-phosphate isomerase A [Candidatus Altiarchaeales archaeon]
MKRSHIEISKMAVGERAVEFVRDGMILGLGTGTTVRYFIEKLAEKIKKESLEIIAIPTSIETEKMADNLEIPLSNLNEYPEVDLDIDGADEVDLNFNLIKGGGGAHTKEKIVAMASKEFIVIVDKTKTVDRIGNTPVPIEVLSFSENFVRKEIQKLGGIARLREDFRTDNGNLILDVRFNIINPEKLEGDINNIPGVIENGIFANRRPEKIIVADGKKVRIMERDLNGGKR